MPYVAHWHFHRFPRKKVAVFRDILSFEPLNV